MRTSGLVNIGYKSKIFEIAFSNKLSLIHFYNFDLEPREEDEWPKYWLNGAELLRTQQTYSALEPSLTMRLGYKYLKGQLQLGMPISRLTILGGTQPLFINLGLSVHIPSKLNRKNKS